MTRAEVPKKAPKVVGLLVGTNNLRAGQSSTKIASLMDYLLGWMQVGWGPRGWAAQWRCATGKQAQCGQSLGSPLRSWEPGSTDLCHLPAPNPTASTCPAVHPTLLGRLSTLEDTGAQPAAAHLARC